LRGGFRISVARGAMVLKCDSAFCSLRIHAYRGPQQNNQDNENPSE
jgi:hypothetical protein